MVAEGVKTATSVVALGNKMGVEMPICQEVFEASVTNVLAQYAIHYCCKMLSSL